MIPLASTLLRGDRTVTQPHDNLPREGAKVFVFNFSSRGYFNSLKFAVLIFLYIPSKTSLLEISRRRRESATNEQNCFGSGRGVLFIMAYRGAGCKQMPFGKKWNKCRSYLLWEHI